MLNKIVINRREYGATIKLDVKDNKIDKSIDVYLSYSTKDSKLTIRQAGVMNIHSLHLEGDNIKKFTDGLASFLEEIAKEEKNHD